MYLEDDDRLYAYSGSKVANYTINYLRLNRMQLIRLRHVRRFMDTWENALNEKLFNVEQEIKSIQEHRVEFINTLQKDKKYANIIDTLFDLLEKQQENSKIFIEEELSKLQYLKNVMRGKDDRCLPIND